MTKPILHFAHANSYPAGTYRLFFEQLKQDFDVRAMPMHAHDPAYPVDDGWKSLGRELSDDLARRYTTPVILVGHSMGGAISLRAALDRPDLVRCVILLDSPIVGGWRAVLLKIMKAINFESKKAPSRFSIKRKNQWQDKAASLRHFQQRRVFAEWPAEVLEDYVDNSIEENEQGATLRFARETETKIYRTIPDDLAVLTRKNFPVPVGFIGGLDSVECRLAGLKATKRLAGNNFIQIPGGHLFPMTAPEQAAQATKKMIEQVLNCIQEKGK